MKAVRASWLFVLALASPLAVPACGGSTSTTDGGLDGDDADAAGLPPEAAATLTSAGFGLGVAVAMTAPLVPSAQSLRETGGRLDAPARENQTRTDVESGVSGSSVVEPPGCAAFSWSGLSAVVTFTGCTLEVTGETIDGSLGLAATFFPTTFTVTVTGLTVGTVQVDGTLALNVGGACGGGDLGCTPCADADPTCAASRVNQQTLVGSLTVRSGGTTVLELTALTLAIDATGATATGDAVLNGTALTATGVHWNTGECLPSSGTVELTASGTTITFLPTTPADGIVEVRIGGWPPFPQALFPPCS